MDSPSRQKFTSRKLLWVKIFTSLCCRGGYLDSPKVGFLLYEPLEVSRSIHNNLFFSGFLLNGLF